MLSSANFFKSLSETSVSSDCKYVQVRHGLLPDHTSIDFLDVSFKCRIADASLCIQMLTLQISYLFAQILITKSRNQKCSISLNLFEYFCKAFKNLNIWTKS